MRIVDDRFGKEFLQNLLDRELDYSEEYLKKKNRKSILKKLLDI